MWRERIDKIMRYDFPYKRLVRGCGVRVNGNYYRHDSLAPYINKIIDVVVSSDGIIRFIYEFQVICKIKEGEFNQPDTLFKREVMTFGECTNTTKLYLLNSITDLEFYSTKELADELAKREGVKKIIAEPYQEYKVTVKKETIKDSGPAIIFVVID